MRWSNKFKIQHLFIKKNISLFMLLSICFFQQLCEDQSRVPNKHVHPSGAAVRTPKARLAAGEGVRYSRCFGAVQLGITDGLSNGSAKNSGSATEADSCQPRPNWKFQATKHLGVCLALDTNKDNIIKDSRLEAMLLGWKPSVVGLPPRPNLDT